MATITNTTYDELNLGQTAEFSKLVTKDEITLFATLSGDHNPVHLDEEFAANSAFKECIAHGMISGALISAAVAMTIPGPGTIYIGQTMSFLKPVKIGDKITVKLEVVEKSAKYRVKIATQVFNQNNEMVVDGIAEVRAPRDKQTVNLPKLPKITIN